MHIATKDLPANLQSFLKRLEYSKRDISLTAKEEISPHMSGSQGSRGYFATFDLATGESNVTEGSFGGANMFNPTNQVDLNDKQYAIPPNTIVVKGTTGYLKTASLYAHPSTVNQTMLPQGEVITEKDASILCSYRGLKSGPYRQDALKAIGCTDTDIDSLVTRRLLKRNSAGSVAITIEGKNATSGHRGPSGLRS